MLSQSLGARTTKRDNRWERAKFEPPKEQKAIQLDPKIFDAYAGEYQVVPGLSVVFTREGDKFFMQPTGQSKVEIFPESETNFFLAVADVQITFVKDDKGEVHEAILHQTGRKLTAKRMK